MNAKPPCTGLCRIDAPTGWCEGCGRTRQGTTQSRKLTSFCRGAVERDLDRRMRQLSDKVAPASTAEEPR